MIGLIVSAEYNGLTALSGILAMVMAHVEPIANNYGMFVNHFATNVVNTAQIHSWWYEEIARVDPAQRTSDTPRAYISVVNELSQWLFSSLTLCIRVWQRLLAPYQQLYTAAIFQSTRYMDIAQSHLQWSRQWLPGYWPNACLHAQQTSVRWVQILICV